MHQNIAQMVEATSNKFSDNDLKENYLTLDGKSDCRKKYFIVGTYINIGENRNVEFKNYHQSSDYGSFQLLILDTIEKYCNAFWNTDGGTIYFGIEDSGIVRGTQPCGLDLIDFLQRAMAQRLKLWEIAVDKANGNRNGNRNKNKHDEGGMKQKLNDFIKIDSVQVIDQGFIAPNTRIIRGTVTSQSKIDDWEDKIQFCDSNGKPWFRAGSAIEILKHFVENNDNENENENLMLMNNNSNNSSNNSSHSNSNSNSNSNNNSSFSNYSREIAMNNDRYRNEEKASFYISTNFREVEKQRKRDLEKLRINVSKVQKALIDMGLKPENVNNDAFGKSIENALQSNRFNIDLTVLHLIDNERATSVEIDISGSDNQASDNQASDNPGSDDKDKDKRNDQDDNNNNDDDDCAPLWGTDDDNDNDSGNNSNINKNNSEKKPEFDLIECEQKQNANIDLEKEKNNANIYDDDDNMELCSNNTDDEDCNVISNNVSNSASKICMICLKNSGKSRSKFYTLESCNHCYCHDCYLMLFKTWQIPACKVEHCEFVITYKDLEKISSQLPPVQANEIAALLIQFKESTPKMNNI